MSALALDYSYSYLHDMRLDRASHDLRLATFSGKKEAHPFVFHDRFTGPKHTAYMLQGLMHIVRTRFQGQDAVPEIEAQLRWQAVIGDDALSTSVGLDRPAVRNVLAACIRLEGAEGA